MAVAFVALVSLALALVRVEASIGPRGTLNIVNKVIKPGMCSPYLLSSCHSPRRVTFTANQMDLIARAYHG